MNADELSFVNRQLESMVKSGIPLEGALKEVVQNLKNGRLRLQLDTVIHSLENGTSLDDAIKDVELPVAYKRILTSGAASGNMGQALNAAAEFFQAQSLAMRQLSTALFYPLITLVVLFCVSVLVGLTTTFLVVSISDPADQSVKMQLLDVSDASAFEMITLLFTTRPGTAIQVWIVPIMLLIFLIWCAVIFGVKPLRDWISWVVPGFSQARIALAAQQLAVIHGSGTSWPESLRSVASLYLSTPIGRELQLWHEKLSQGKTSPGDLLNIQGPMPPIFRYLIASSGENLQDGLVHLAAVYREKSNYLFDCLSRVVTPAATLFVGFFIIGQTAPILRLILQSINSLGGV